MKYLLMLAAVLLGAGALIVASSDKLTGAFPALCFGAVITMLLGAILANRNK